MDRANDVVYIDFTGVVDPTHIFLAWLARVKGLRTSVVETNAARSPAIVYQGIQIEGFWPCVDFLLDARPYPDVLPDTPGKRAVVRSLTERILADPTTLGEIAVYYLTPQGPELPARLTLMDLAVVAQSFTLHTHRYPWLSSIARQVDARLAAMREPDMTLEAV